MIASRWLFGRMVRWTLLVLAAAALLGLVVDSLELGARLGRGEHGLGWVQALLLSLLALPERMVQILPLIAALAGALTVAGLSRSGEWQALAAAGVGSWKRLLPVLVVGALLGLAGLLAQEALIPRCTLEATRRIAWQQAGLAEQRPVAFNEGGGGWYASPRLVLHVDALKELEGTHTLSGVRLWRIDPDGLGALFSASSLTWREGAWTVDGTDVSVLWTQRALSDSWSLIPAPEDLSPFLSGQSPSQTRARLLIQRATPAASAELWARVGRAAALGPLALMGGAMIALLGTSPWMILLALCPVLIVESLALSTQAVAAEGSFPASSSAWLRLLLLAAAVLLLRARFQRPGPGG